MPTKKQIQTHAATSIDKSKKPPTKKRARQAKESSLEVQSVPDDVEPSDNAENSIQIKPKRQQSRGQQSLVNGTVFSSEAERNGMAEPPNKGKRSKTKVKKVSVVLNDVFGDSHEIRKTPKPKKTNIAENIEQNSVSNQRSQPARHGALEILARDGQANAITDLNGIIGQLLEEQEKLREENERFRNLISKTPKSTKGKRLLPTPEQIAKNLKRVSKQAQQGN
jgi:hypothetical protein